MKTKQSTELANTLSIHDDMLSDAVAKHLFAINDVIAWLLKACVPEYMQIEPAEIISRQLAQADIRLGKLSRRMYGHACQSSARKTKASQRGWSCMIYGRNCHCRTLLQKHRSSFWMWKCKKIMIAGFYFTKE